MERSLFCQSRPHLTYPFLGGYTLINSQRVIDWMNAANVTHGEVRMKIKLASVYVDDQEKALRFYTEVLGLTKKADFSNGPYRWLTVTSPEEPEGTELQLALDDNPAAKAYQQAIFKQGQPAVMFFTDDVKRDYERIRARGAEFTQPPTEATGSTIAQLNDACGNLVQITQLARW